MSTKVVVSGPSSSGKSTFTASLIESLRISLGERFSEYVKSVQLDPWDPTLHDLIDTTGYQPPSKEPTRADLEEIAELFRAADAPLVIGDAPGAIDDKLELLIEPADSMIIVAQEGKLDHVPRWEEVACRLNIEVKACFRTVLDDDAEPFWDTDKGVGLLANLDSEAFESNRLHSYDPATERIIREVSLTLLE